ncbi:MAG TPA: DUF5706 domain-containing protein [Saprospiraceae bacterium]|nr:DUF5706 domain-containing protein [Saprospiraceae bacterium]
MESQQPILKLTENFVSDFFRKNIGAEFVFHDINHTREVVASSLEIAEGYELSEKELEILALAAWFHDTGYNEGPEGHEQRGCKLAADFLKQHQFSDSDLAVIAGLIMATKLPQQPASLLEEIICDADMSHLGKKNYWDRCGCIRQEFLMTRNTVMSEQEWVDFEINFMTNHRYHTTFAQELYDKRKHKHIRQLVKQKLRLNPAELNSEEKLVNTDWDRRKKLEKFSKKLKTNELEIKELRLGRGVETMYRTAYRTHVNLSAIADNKANIMLSINAIIISIIVSTLVPTFGTNPRLILPTAILVLVCLVAMVFATLSTRPKVTEGRVTREDIMNRKANLLFFGNFYKMPLEEYDWGMKEMIKDSDFLYTTMTKDLYFLGIVLAKKYRYLSYCYAVFMYGLIAAVLAFAVSFMF